jgi:molybdate transport system ATP-binding protein
VNVAPHNQVRLHWQRAGFELAVDLSLPATGITVLFGASGSGKTTLLRCVAGLERAQHARVQIGDEVWQDDDARIFVPTWRRALGYVFQEASLFEHLTVQQNLRYGLRRSGQPSASDALDAPVSLLGIGHLLGRMPAGLSGGERQRVAIARALATQPRLLLLDEPLASLDHARKQDILPWLERLRDGCGTPMLYVTHAADELARLADHVVLLDQGRVRTQGPVAEVMAALGTPVLAGDERGALLSGQVVERDTDWHLCRVAFDGGSLWLRDTGLALGRAVRLRVLARDVSLATQEPVGTSIQNQLRCVVEALAPDPHPSQQLVQLRVGGSLLLARVTARSAHALGLQPGQALWLQVKSVAVLD